MPPHPHISPLPRVRTHTCFHDVHIAAWSVSKIVAVLFPSRHPAELIVIRWLARAVLIFLSDAKYQTRNIRHACLEE